MRDGFESLDYVKRTYGVPVKVGQRVVHEGRDHGTVLGGINAHVAVQFDGEESWSPCHPLSLDYGDGISPEVRTAARNRQIDVWNDWLNERITDDEYQERFAAAGEEK